MDKDYIVLQVRLSSSRLPGKLLLPLKGISIFEHIIIRLKMVQLADGIIVATTADTEPSIRSIVSRYGVHILIGSENDVLSRFVTAVKRYRIRNVIRTTGDNPLVDIEHIDKALLLHTKKKADLTIYPSLPYGSGVEVVRGEVLTKIDTLTSDPFEREHITQYIYRHAREFSIIHGALGAHFSRPDIRLTVDTEEDYLKLVDIYENLYTGVPIKLTDVINYVDHEWN
jgi:spore coat polysaccharide biosynthesis protein SpsF